MLFIKRSPSNHFTELLFNAAWEIAELQCVLWKSFPLTSALLNNEFNKFTYYLRGLSTDNLGNVKNPFLKKVKSGCLEKQRHQKKKKS